MSDCKFQLVIFCLCSRGLNHSTTCTLHQWYGTKKLLKQPRPVLSNDGTHFRTVSIIPATDYYNHLCGCAPINQNKYSNKRYETTHRNFSHWRFEPTTCNVPSTPLTHSATGDFTTCDDKFQLLYAIKHPISTIMSCGSLTVNIKIVAVFIRTKFRLTELVPSDRTTCQILTQKSPVF